MNCTKRITITGYTVRYVDLREPKPRAIHETVCPVDADSMAALARLGLNVADFITAKYTGAGYHITGIERITARRTVAVDLCKLWQSTEPATMEDAAGAA